MTLTLWKLLQKNLKHKQPGLHAFAWVCSEEGCLSNLQLFIILCQVNSRFPRGTVGERRTNRDVIPHGAAEIQTTGQASAACEQLSCSHAQSKCTPLPRWANAWGGDHKGSLKSKGSKPTSGGKRALSYLLSFNTVLLLWKMRITLDLR